jgi:hypothetical protein
MNLIKLSDTQWLDSLHLAFHGVYVDSSIVDPRPLHLIVPIRSGYYTELSLQENQPNVTGCD